MSQTALVTGASAGIGREFAKYHAARGGDVILTARREQALMALKADLEAAHGITAHVFALDLSAPDGAAQLYDAIAAAGLRVDILINNAGFGGRGQHVDRDLAAELSMIDLNIKALVTLTHRIAQDMVAQGGGKILNIGSTAGFMPGPQQAVYFATKAFVNSFSQALDQELRAKGVTCTVLAPGYVDTEFAHVADLEGTQLTKGGGAKASEVAKRGYDAMQRGELLCINDRALSVALQWIVPLLPRRAVLKLVDRAQSK